MAIIKGNKVWKATQYELYEVLESYTLTIENDYQPSHWLLYINGQLVKDEHENKEGVYTDVKTFGYCAYGGESPYLIDSEGNWYYMSEDAVTTTKLTSDLVISYVDK